MRPDMKSKLKQILINHEGYKEQIYIDTIGKHIIGIGRNLDERGVLPAEIDMMFDHDSQYFYDQLDSYFSWFSALTMARQIALIDLCFMGFKKFLEFEKMIEYLAVFDYDNATDELLDSDWAKQVGRRADDIAMILVTGEL